MKKTEKITYGIMSTANIVERFVQGVRASKNGEVVAMASRTKERAEKKAAELNIPRSFGSYEELVAQSDIQVIYIPSINHKHFENAKLAISHGKHVLVEKPMTLSKEDTKELFRLAKENKVFIMEAQKSVFLPVTLEVKKRINEGVIGKVHHGRYTMSYHDVEFGWFYDVEKGGGVAYGNAGYILSHSSSILGEDLILGSAEATLNEQGVDLACILNLRTPSGTLIQGHVTTLLNLESQAEFFGEKGKIVIPNFWKARKALLYVEGKEVQEISYPVDHEMVYEIDHANECIERGLLVSPVMTKDLSVEIARKIDKIHEEYEKNNQGSNSSKI